MTKPIVQSVRFSVSPDELFDTFLDSKKHSESTGGSARISKKVGGKFTAWDGALAGHNLLIVPDRMIVQAWRATHWKKSDPDSILILHFSKAPGGSQVDMVHSNVPAYDHKGVSLGWPKYYWKPWAEYFSGRSRS